jgi:hypothetical protein
VSTETPSALLWRRAFEPRSRLSLMSSLLVCCPLPTHATAQTHCRLRAGHRAEPVACRCHCRHRRARSFALQLCRSFVRRASPSFGLPPVLTRLSRRHRSKTLPFFGWESCEHRPSSCTLPRLSSTRRCPLPSACRWCCVVTMAAPPMICLRTPPLG